MKLYHYSTELFDTIRSRVLQEADKEIEPPSAEEDGHDLAYMKELLMFQKRVAPEERDYRRHISLFLEPIPRNLPSILHNEHQFWKSGRVLWEYIIDSRDLPKSIPFRIVETPEAVELLYEKQDWTHAKGNPDLVKKYVAQKKQLEIELGLHDEGRVKFEVAAKKYSKGIADYYAQAYELHTKYPEDKVMEKYASCVPHALIYPGVQFISINERQQIKLK